MTGKGQLSALAAFLTCSPGQGLRVRSVFYQAEEAAVFICVLGSFTFPPLTYISHSWEYLAEHSMQGKRYCLFIKYSRHLKGALISLGTLGLVNMARNSSGH